MHPPNKKEDTSKDSSDNESGGNPPVSYDEGYGWVLTAALTLINIHSWGINSAYAVFLAYYIKHSTFEGATRLHYALIGGLSVACAFLTAPFSTVLVRKFGTRPVMLIGSVLQTGSLIASSFSTNIWNLFLSQGLMFGLGMGFLFLPTYGVISQWFQKKRALANGIAISGGGLGGLTYSLGSSAMIENLGLDWTFRILAIICFVVNTACVLIVKTRHDDTSETRSVPFDRKMMRRPEYLIIIVYSMFSMLGYLILLFSLANYGTEMGLTTSQASLLPALLSLGQAIGRPLMGQLSDRLGSITASTILTYLIGIFSLVIWTNARTFGVMIFFSLIEGLVAGAFWVTIGALLADVVGTSNLPAALSMLWVALIVPTTFSEAIALEIAEKTGSYIGVQIFTGVMFIAGGFCLNILRGWRVVSLKKKTAEDEEATGEWDFSWDFARACVSRRRV